MKKRYYLISCERGHLGRGKGATICFAIQAYNLPQAMNIARRMPAVKHTRMINYGREITEEEYIEYRKVSAYKDRRGCLILVFCSSAVRRDALNHVSGSMKHRSGNHNHHEHKSKR